MNIIITDTGSYDRLRLVSFKTAYGFGEAVWHGITPEVGKTYTVEFEIPYRLEWTKSIFATTYPLTDMSVKGDLVNIHGVLDNIEPDGVCIIRLGESTIIVETDDVPKDVQIGVGVNILILNLQVFDINL